MVGEAGPLRVWLRAGSCLFPAAGSGRRARSGLPAVLACTAAGLSCRQLTCPSLRWLNAALLPAIGSFSILSPSAAELFDETGELDMDHIFCAKCRKNHCDDVSSPPPLCLLSPPASLPACPVALCCCSCLVRDSCCRGACGEPLPGQPEQARA